MVCRNYEKIQRFEVGGDPSQKSINQYQNWYPPRHYQILKKKIEE